MPQSFEVVRCSHLLPIAAFVFVTCGPALPAQTKATKAAAPAPKAAAPAPKAAPSRPASTPGASSGAAKGATTSSHGPTTSTGATTASHGPTTSAGSGATTANHGPTTSAGSGATTANHGATTAGAGATTANHGATTAGAGAGATTTTRGTTTTTSGGAAVTTTHTPTASPTPTTTGAPKTATGSTAGHTPATGSTASGTGTHSPSGNAAAVDHAAKGPAGANAPHPGGIAANPSRGAMGRPAPTGTREFHGANGGEARLRANGRPMDVHDARRGMDIHHNYYGGRAVYVNRPGGGRMYYERGRPGYIGHPYMVHGHEFNRRTYYYNGRAYDRYYRPYGYHGYALEVYAPVRYYPAAYYGWAYNPWANPVSYAWGFAGSPWYGYYGGYFNPYPVYSTPSLWLTDYMISQSLAAAYQAQVASGQAAAAQSAAAEAMSADVKQMVATEVQREIALENAEAQQNAQQQPPDPASSGIARLFSDGHPHVFVAGKEVDVVDAAGQECAVTDGDVLQMTTPPGESDTTANVVVLSSKGQDCKRSATVTIALDELQNMSNHMRETVDQGLQELQAKQGKGGLPAAPASALAPPVTALVAENAPPPDPNGEKELAQQAQASDSAEKDVLAGANAGATPAPPADALASSAPPAEISIAPGQTIDQVKGSLGTPTKVVNLGTKTMYFYKDMKVTFNNGKVTSIE